jgi:DNA-directed RNA polymerase specialized sigma24 family protein
MERAYEALRLYERGLTYREVADKMGVCHQRVHQLVARARKTRARRAERGVM